MKKIKHVLLFAAIIFTLTSCLNLTEEITFNTDGSGDYVTTTDMVGYMDQMATLATFDTTGKVLPAAEKTMDSTFAETVKKYSAIKGISEVMLDKSVKNIYKISLHFFDVDALNKVVDQEKDETIEKELYSWSKGKLTRKEGGVSLMGGALGNTEEEKDMMETYLKDMKYKVIYHFPSKVKKMSNINAILSDDKKTVIIETNFRELNDKTITLGNELKY